MHRYSKTTQQQPHINYSSIIRPQFLEPHGNRHAKKHRPFLSNKCQLGFDKQRFVFITPSAAGPFSSSRLPFCGLGASILAPWGTILAPREHPGEPFWHLRTTLEDHGSSRMGARWSGTGFSLISHWFWDLILKVVLTPGLEIPICFRACLQLIFYRFLNRHLHAWGS